ncbi:MAG TPA: biopolymer transporter ExbD [Pyrinomonadaceae bacterium]|nr:biopolymer transporter ExbD [Pyrinomonadaceae bacterium]
MRTKPDHENRPIPFINVTPLIDVLLVLLIIFMVASPLRHAKFEAKLPSQPDHDTRVRQNPLTLLVTIEADHTLKLNSLGDLGTVEDTAKLSAKLSEVFRERKQNHTYRADMLGRVDLPEDVRVEKTVFIRALRSTSYGDVAKVIDGIKGAGAQPVGLQLDGLN